MSSAPDNFLGMEGKLAEYESARFAVLPIPYDATATFLSGSRNGPRAIITASQQVELFDNELGAEFHKAGVCTLDPVWPDAGSPEAMHDIIFKRAKPIVRDGKFLIGLGGEHGITSGLVRAVASKYRKLSVLQLDAHADLRDQYQGTRFSHASVMRRVLEHADRLVQVGVRSLSLEEHRFLKKGNVLSISDRETFMNDFWFDDVLDNLGDVVYVTIDIDAFDPAYAPGTGTPEPGGLDWYQVTYLLGRVAAAKKIVAADVVEVIPLPNQAVTEFLAARLIYKLIAYVQSPPSEPLP